MEIKWQNTHSSTERYAHDLTARTANGIDIGRIYRIDTCAKKGRWHWTFLRGHSLFRTGLMSGDQSSKQRAAEHVCKIFERYLETPGSDGGGMSRIPVKKAG